MTVLLTVASELSNTTFGRKLNLGGSDVARLAENDPTEIGRSGQCDIV